MFFVESPQGVVVWMLPPGQPQIRYLVLAGRLQLPAGAHPGHEAVQPHAQQRTRMVPSGLLLSLRQAPPSRPYPTRPRTQPRIAPGDTMAKARQETVATATSAPGPYLGGISASPQLMSLQMYTRRHIQRHLGLLRQAHIRGTQTTPNKPTRASGPPS